MPKNISILIYLFSTAVVFTCSGIEPLIYCSFDKDADATLQNRSDSAEPQSIHGIFNPHSHRLSLEEQFPKGISGRAFLAGRTKDGRNDYSLTYRLKDGLSPKAGTVSFWISPQDWQGNDQNLFHLFFSASSRDQTLVIYKYQDGERILFYLNHDNKERTAAEYNISDWQKNDFHHVAAVWNQKEILLYTDGMFRDSRELSTPSVHPYTSFTIGNLDNWERTNGLTLIDEVRIFSHCLTAREITEEFARSAPLVKYSQAPLFIGLNERTPLPDGKIGDGEYGFSGSGFWNIASRRYANNQSRYFLAQDQKNLYVAIITPATGLQTTRKQHDQALWTDDSIEIHLTGINDGKDQYQFIINAADTIYDSRNGQSSWNAHGVYSTSRVTEGLWTCEIVLPLINFTQNSIDHIKFNLCRTFIRQNEYTSICPCFLLYQNPINYAEIKFDRNYPMVQLSDFGELNSRHLKLKGRILSNQEDVLSIRIISPAPTRPFAFAQENISLQQGEGHVFKTSSSSLPSEGKLNISLTSEKCKEIYRTSLEYQEQQPLTFSHFYTDIPTGTFFLVCRNTRIGAAPSRVDIRFRSLPDQKSRLEHSAILQTDTSIVKTAVPISQLPPGDYRVEYSFSNIKGKEFHHGFELYRVYSDTPPWTGCRAGISDEIPSPWTPITVGQDHFACWGHFYHFGNGLLNSIKTQQKELLTSPIECRLNDQEIIFTPRLRQAHKSYAEHELDASVQGIKISCSIKSEFDGLLWCRLRIAPQSATADVQELSLSIPLKKCHADYFDDCNLAWAKTVLRNMPCGQITNDLSEKPFFWIGTDTVGLMGGLENLRGWHTRDLSRSMTLNILPDAIRITWNLIDTPFALRKERIIQFYLQATPVKPKNRHAALLRSSPYLHGKNSCRLSTFTWSRFFDMLDPAFLHYPYLKELQDEQKRDPDRTLFHYTSAAGVSPFSPDWGWFGKYWICSPPYLGANQIDSDVSTREKRNRFTWQHGCMNNRSFLDYKIYSLNRVLNLKEVNLQNLYIDLAWPYICDNPEHHCGWTDDFGRRQTTRSVAGTREFYLRAYKLLRRKNPQAMFTGHLTHTRTPADSFFDHLLRGEVYSHQVGEAGGTYFDVFNPDTLRVSEASRSNEQTIWMISQQQRSLVFFHPEKAKQYDQDTPGTDLAIRHYLGYLLLFNMRHYECWYGDATKRQKQIHQAQNRLGWNEDIVFHPYWEKDNPVRILHPVSSRILSSSYANNQKLMTILLNDTDRTESICLKFNPNQQGFNASRRGEEIFTASSYRLKNGQLTISLKPRETRLLLFE